MKPAEENADAILDTGAEGLRYFEVFVPRYREWTGNEPSGGGYHALAARYDQQRGMDLRPMRAVANALADEVEGRLAGDADIQRARIAALAEHWNGSPAAMQAQQFLADVGTRTQTGIDLLRVVHTAATTAVDELERALYDKAKAARTGFDADTSAGKTPQQIDWIIDIALPYGDASGEPHRERLQDLLPEQSAEDADPQRVCRDWLDQVFVDEVDTKVTEFTALCSDAHTAVCAAYERLAHALHAVEAAGFVSPGGQPSHGFEATYGTDESDDPATTDAARAGADPTRLLSLRNNSSIPAGQPQNQEPTANNAGMSTFSSLDLMTTPASAANGEHTHGSGSNRADAPPVSTPVPTTTTTPEPAAVRDDADQPAAPPDRGAALDEDGSSPPERETSADPSNASEGQVAGDIASVVTAASHITGTIPEFVSAVADMTGSLDEVITAVGEATSSVIGAAGEAFPVVPDMDETPGAAPPTNAEDETQLACDEPETPPQPEITTAPDECAVLENPVPDDGPAPVEKSDDAVTTTPVPGAAPEPEPEPEKTGAELPPPAEPLKYGTETAAVFPVGSRHSSIAGSPPHQPQGAVVSSWNHRSENVNI